MLTVDGHPIESHKITLSNLYSIITPMYLKILWKMEHGANALISIIFTDISKTFHKFFLIFFQCYLKIENDVMI